MHVLRILRGRCPTKGFFVLQVLTMYSRGAAPRLSLAGPAISAHETVNPALARNLVKKRSDTDLSVIRVRQVDAFGTKVQPALRSRDVQWSMRRISSIGLCSPHGAPLSEPRYGVVVLRSNLVRHGTALAVVIEAKKLVVGLDGLAVFLARGGRWPHVLRSEQDSLPQRMDSGDIVAEVHVVAIL